MHGKNHSLGMRRPRFSFVLVAEKIRFFIDRWERFFACVCGQTMAIRYSISYRRNCQNFSPSHPTFEGQGTSKPLSNPDFDPSMWAAGKKPYFSIWEIAWAGGDLDLLRETPA